MNGKEFFKLVEKMRSAQLNSEKYYSSSYKKLQKELEKQVDEEIKRVNQILRDKEQMKLFD